MDLEAFQLLVRITNEQKIIYPKKFVRRQPFRLCGSISQSRQPHRRATTLENIGF